MVLATWWWIHCQWQWHMFTRCVSVKKPPAPWLLPPGCVAEWVSHRDDRPLSVSQVVLYVGLGWMWGQQNMCIHPVNMSCWKGRVRQCFWLIEKIKKSSMTCFTWWIISTRQEVGLRPEVIQCKPCASHYMSRRLFKVFWCNLNLMIID